MTAQKKECPRKANSEGRKSAAWQQHDAKKTYSALIPPVNEYSLFALLFKGVFSE